MGKTASEIMKIIVSIIFSSLMTIVIMSGTVIKSKADKDYVDKGDKELNEKIKSVKVDYKAEYKALKDDFLIVVTEIKESQKTTQSDIKKILEKI